MGALSRGSTAITVTALTGIGVSFLVDNQNFIAGTKVVSTSAVSGGGNCIYRSKFYKYNKCNSQTVKFLGQDSIYFSASTKSIIIGGTFANNTNNSVNLSVEIYDSSVGVTSTGSVAIASKIPVPSGSSFVISDTGKTLLESADELKVYCDSEAAIDVSLSILTGVN